MQAFSYGEFNIIREQNNSLNVPLLFRWAKEFRKLAFVQCFLFNSGISKIRFSDIFDKQSFKTPNPNPKMN